MTLTLLLSTVADCILVGLAPTAFLFSMCLVDCYFYCNLILLIALSILCLLSVYLNKRCHYRRFVTAVCLSYSLLSFADWLGHSHRSYRGVIAAAAPGVRKSAVDLGLQPTTFEAVCVRVSVASTHYFVLLTYRPGSAGCCHSGVLHGVFRRTGQFVFFVRRFRRCW